LERQRNLQCRELQRRFLDGTIESFHKTFGLDSYGRARGRAQQRQRHPRSQEYADGVPELPPGRGLLDPTFGLRYSFAAAPSPWNLVVESAVKVPIDGQRDFLSTGHTDIGLEATLQRFAGRHAAYLSAAAVPHQGQRPDIVERPDADRAHLYLRL